MLCDKPHVFQAFINYQLIPGIFAVTWPVKADNTKAFVLGGDPVREFFYSFIVLVSAEAIGCQYDVFQIMRSFIVIKLAANAEAFFIYIK